MEPAAVSPFAAWENFYVIVGSSAAALTGLQFVVVTLGAEARSMRALSDWPSCRRTTRSATG